MIHTEAFGSKFVRTFSDTYWIERDGVMYIDAVDPVDSERVYTETDVLLPDDEEETEVEVEDEV